MTNSMFELLMELPLFRGVSHQRLAEVVGRAKFHFLKYPENEVILRAEEECRHLVSVIGGSVRLTVANSTGRFEVSSTLDAPAVISPDFLFGRLTRYPCTVTAQTTCSLLQIDKADFVKILNSDEIFLFNYLNTLSVNAQKAQHGLLALTSGSVDERIAFWIMSLTQPGSRDILMSCSTRELCGLFNVPRQSFEAVAQSMEARGLIEYTPRSIRIVDRRELVSILEKASESTDDD